MALNTTGNNNSAVGLANFYNLKTGTHNSALGTWCGFNISGGNHNVLIGRDAGFSNLLNGNENTLVGSYSEMTGDFTRASCLGAYTSITANNQVVLGASAEYVFIPSIRASTTTSTGALSWLVGLVLVEILM